MRRECSDREKRECEVARGSERERGREVWVGGGEGEGELYEAMVMVVYF